MIEAEQPCDNDRWATKSIDLNISTQMESGGTHQLRPRCMLLEPKKTKLLVLI